MIAVFILSYIGAALLGAIIWSVVFYLLMERATTDTKPAPKPLHIYSSDDIPAQRVGENPFEQ